MRDRAAAVLLLIAAAGCRGEVPPSHQAAPRPPRPVRTAAVRTAEAAGSGTPATVVARSRAVLSPRSTAAVTALPFREGDRFAKGAVLVRLDDGALRAGHAAALANATAAEADRSRAESLLARGAATPREAEQARAQAETSRAAVLAAREALAYAELRAPFAGTVAARPAHVGDIAGPGTPLLEIEGLDGLELHADLDAAAAASLRPGQRLDAAIDGVPEAVTATVRTLSAAGDPATHRFELRATLPPRPGLRSGLFARLVLPAAGRPARLVVPAASVFARGGLTGVYVVSDGRARLRWIAPGVTTAGATEVRAGLDADERVVLDPPKDLDDGHPVTEAH